jgi:thiol-disulfide isomerase/thioredoxin
MKPVVDRLKKEYAGKVDIRRMDISKGDPEVNRIGLSYGIQYVPTFVFVDSSGVKQDLLVGETSYAVLRTKLDALK